MTRWCSCRWDEEDITYLVELDAEGHVLRQIELQGPARTPLAAACAIEREHAYAAGRVAAYEAAYGFTAELPFTEWEGHDPQSLSAAEFDSAWTAARAQLTARARPFSRTARPAAPVCVRS